MLVSAAVTVLGVYLVLHLLDLVQPVPQPLRPTHLGLHLFDVGGGDA